MRTVDLLTFGVMKARMVKVHKGANGVAPLESARAWAVMKNVHNLMGTTLL